MQPSSEVPTRSIDNLLGENTSCTGTLKSDGNIRVDGFYQGRIETAGNVIIGPFAKVLADIVADTVQVWGAVRGQIIARGRLEVLPSGHVWGDVEVSSLLIDEGGTFRGQCLMTGQDPPTLIGRDGRARVMRDPDSARLTHAPSETSESGGEASSVRDWQGADPDPMGSTALDLGSVDE